MDIFLVILGFLCMLVALTSIVLPIIPGPALGFVGLLLLQATSGHPFSRGFFAVRGCIMIILSILDYLIPVWGTKAFGGTKWGARGSMIGLIIAVIILPIGGSVLGPFGILGIIIGPFFGAYIGEKIAGRQHSFALRAAWGSFLGVLAGTVLKAVVCIIMFVLFCTKVYPVLVR